MRRLVTLTLVASLTAGACAVRAGRAGVSGTSRPARGHVLAVILNSTGQVAGMLRGDGGISAAIADGRGGWYVQGAFHALQGAVRDGLARVESDGRVDRLWRPAPPAAGLGLGAASGTAVYLSAHIDDSDTYRLEVLSARTGSSLAARVLPGAGGPMAAAAGRLFVANPLPITSCIDAYGSLGHPLLYRFAVHMLPEATCVNALAVAGEELYAAGSLGLRSASVAVARFHLPSGRLDTPWRASPRPCSTCYGLAYSMAVSRGRVFVNPGARNEAVSALSAASGALIAGWRPPGLSGFDSPLALAVAGDRLFVLEGPPHQGALRGGHGLIALDMRTGAELASWHPPPRSSATLLAASRGQVLVALSAPAPRTG